MRCWKSLFIETTKPFVDARIWCLALLLMAVGVTVGAQNARQNGAGSRSVRDGVYTGEQARRGDAAYQDRCAACHEGTLSGGVMGVIRKFMRESICGRSGRITRQAIFMVQPSQNRCREHPSVFGEAMTGGRELVAFGQRIGNPGSQAGMWAAPVVQVDNATPIVPRREKSAIRGIRGSVGLSWCTRR
jgi:hypothetical protein